MSKITSTESVGLRLFAFWGICTSCGRNTSKQIPNRVCEICLFPKPCDCLRASLSTQRFSRAADLEQPEFTQQKSSRQKLDATSLSDTAKKTGEETYEIDTDLSDYETTTCRLPSLATKHSVTNFAISQVASVLDRAESIDASAPD